MGVGAFRVVSTLTNLVLQQEAQFIAGVGLIEVKIKEIFFPSLNSTNTYHSNLYNVVATSAMIL